MPTNTDPTWGDVFDASPTKLAIHLGIAKRTTESAGYPAAFGYLCGAVESFLDDLNTACKLRAEAEDEADHRDDEKEHAARSTQ